VKLFIAIMYVLALFVSMPHVFKQKASAISENLVIYQVQTGGALSGTTSQEVVVLYNSSQLPVNVTGWCIDYSAAASGIVWTKLACVTSPTVSTQLWVEPSGVFTFATTEFMGANVGFVSDFVFSSGLAGTGGHIRLLDSSKIEIDRVGWGNAVAPEGTSALIQIAGKVLSRDSSKEILDSDVNLVDFSSQSIINPIISGLYEVEAAVDECPNIKGQQEFLPAGYLKDSTGDCYLDFCPNIEGLQLEAPVGYEKNSGSENCSEIALENSVLIITELLPNAPSTDTGNEFIEIYNPNNKSVELAGYSLQVGPNYTKQFTLTSGTIKANDYVVFSDTDSGIVLPNTTGISLRIVAPAGNVVFESSIYSNAGDSVSWALVEDQWIYTNRPTPGATNLPFLEAALNEEMGVTTLLAPCPEGKFRNPDTNRCKTFETAVSALQPCDEDEYRNPQTNRCNKVLLTTSGLTPCKPGQERNPETNRCRTITSASILAPCPEGQERNPETNRCRKVSVLGATSDDLPTVTDIAVESSAGSINWTAIVIALFGTFGYMIYEWRSEIAISYGRMRGKLVQ
jgi:hypothetical protein